MMHELQDNFSVTIPKISTIIIEDDSIWQTILQKLVESKSELSCIGVYATLEEAEKVIQKEEVELILLDVEVQGQNAIEFIKKFDKNISIIIISSHEKYALSGYEINASDFLVKPIELEKFNLAIQKIANRSKVETENLKKNKYLFNKDYLLIKTEGAYIKILYDEVIYITALQNYIKIQTLNKVHIVLTTLLHFEQNLNEHPFLRVHRSYVVNMNAIKQIEKDEIILTNEFKVPIGLNYKDLLFDIFIKQNIVKRY